MIYRGAAAQVINHLRILCRRSTHIVQDHSQRAGYCIPPSNRTCSIPSGLWYYFAAPCPAVTTSCGRLMMSPSITRFVKDAHKAALDILWATEHAFRVSSRGPILEVETAEQDRS
jgi:hypothetical protein